MEKEPITLNGLNNLKEEFVDFSYVKITPKNLIGSDEFNELFFKKIDEIENKISNDVSFVEILDDLKIKSIKKEKYKPINEENSIEDKIYEKRNENNVQLIDENEFYVLFKINNINKIMPSIKNEKFLKKVQNSIFEENKYKYNKK